MTRPLRAVLIPALGRCPHRSIEKLPCLQRVFVSNNALASLDSLASIFAAKNLLELALDGNPVASEPGYRQVGPAPVAPNARDPARPRGPGSS